MLAGLKKDIPKMGARGRERTYSERVTSAVTGGDLEELKILLDKPGVDHINALGHAALHEAACWGNLKAIDFILRLKGDINVKSSGGCTPLALAVDHNQEEAVNLLLSRGASPDESDAKGVTPLMKAAEAGAAGIVASLVTHNAALEKKDGEGRTALMAAAQKGQAMIVGALAGRGAALTVTDNEGNTVMHYAVTCQENDVMLQFLAEKDRGLLNRPNKVGETPAIVAVKRSQPENLQTLLNLGADPAIPDNSGKNAVDHGRTLKRAKFRTAMKEVMENEGEAARQHMRRGTEEKISVRKPLRLKKTASFTS
ncbi:MAG: ankyrin repeat domain-containing protein [Alphaproteobacteria bacterium]|nr:MAG: ankyrin repeat domain-containing protein [Alphaproteobacteria bacterium]